MFYYCNNSCICIKYEQVFNYFMYVGIRYYCNEQFLKEKKIYLDTLSFYKFLET